MRSVHLDLAKDAGPEAFTQHPPRYSAAEREAAQHEERNGSNRQHRRRRTSPTSAANDDWCWYPALALSSIIDILHRRRLVESCDKWASRHGW